MSRPLEDLIYDRTLEDVTSNNEKGNHNYTDLNRIENWCKYIAEELTKANYPVYITTKTDWTMTTPRTISQIERIRSNVLAIKTAYYSNPDTPGIPANLSPINVTLANDIERILYDVDQILNNTKLRYAHLGVSNMGQENNWFRRWRA